ncbi:MAG: pyruvoyl-dependent arginine decarboxylase [Candidatus Asgardarchaeia archaeon]
MFNHIPKYVFLTKGVGRHANKLISFELALRDAKIQKYNLVKVSSILPPNVKIIDVDEGIKMLKEGQVVFTVLSQISSNKAGDFISASIGIAYPKDRRRYGYISEHCSKNKDEDCGKIAQDIALEMLKTTGEFTDVESMNVSQSALVESDGMWITVIAAAVLI